MTWLNRGLFAAAGVGGAFGAVKLFESYLTYSMKKECEDLGENKLFFASGMKAENKTKMHFYVCPTCDDDKKINILYKRYAFQGADWDLPCIIGGSMPNYTNRPANFFINLPSDQKQFIQLKYELKYPEGRETVQLIEPVGISPEKDQQFQEMLERVYTCYLKSSREQFDDCMGVTSTGKFLSEFPKNSLPSHLPKKIRNLPVDQQESLYVSCGSDYNCHLLKAKIIDGKDL